MLEFNSGFIFTIINLIVLCLLLRKFLFGPVTKIMAQREELIHNTVDEAKRREETAQALLADAQRQVTGAAQEAERVSRLRLQEAQAREEALLEEARAESQRIIDLGKKKAEEERRQLLAGAKAQVVDMALETARRVAGSRAEPEHAEKLFQSLLEEVGEPNE